MNLRAIIASFNFRLSVRITSFCSVISFSSKEALFSALVARLLNDDMHPSSVVDVLSFCATPADPEDLLICNRDRNRDTSACSATMLPQVSSLRTAVFLISLARCAKLSVDSVSPVDTADGLIVAIRHVFELPPQESRSRKVSYTKI